MTFDEWFQKFVPEDQQTDYNQHTHQRAYAAGYAQGQSEIQKQMEEEISALHSCIRDLQETVNKLFI